MQSDKFLRARVPLFVATALAIVLLTAGCDEYIHITRDRDARIARHATWAWRPAPEQSARRNSRPVTSRDVITRGETETVTREENAENDLLRGKVRSAIERDLDQKGLKQVSDPEAADLLVDFHIAVRRRNMTVAYPGAYPGLMCGPFGCYGGWGYGAVGYENVHFREGTIVLDLFQNPANHLIYRAQGEKPVRRDTFSFSQDEVNGLVRGLLKDLKPSRK